MEVREMLFNRTHRKTYSNIKTTIKHQLELKPGMIIKKEVVGSKKSKGEEVSIYEYKLNLDFWKSIKEPINVVLDEAHTILNSRRSMSKTNIILTDWLALVRRVLGGTEGGYGELVFITQLPNRIDNIAREMAHQVRYHICHYAKSCKVCGTSWREHSEVSESIYSCPRCASPDLLKHSHYLQIWFFDSMENFQAWKTFGATTYYKQIYVWDIEKVFSLYSTLQWDNLFSEHY